MEPISQEALKPAKIAIVWYSQTGNTESVGKKIAESLSEKRIKTISSDYRNFDTDELGTSDIIVVGTPVYYYEVPKNFKEWLSELKNFKNKSFACFVTYGGEGGNQRNTLVSLAGILKEKGGIPTGMATFGFMSSYAVTWSMGNIRRILKYRNLPNEQTWAQVENFTTEFLNNYNNRLFKSLSKEFTISDFFKGSLSISLSKFFTTRHSIDKKMCINCGLCVMKCPVKAVNPEKGKIDRKKCIACLGCINNCPTGAVNMAYMGKKVYGLKIFKKKYPASLKENFEK